MQSPDIDQLIAEAKAGHVGAPAPQPIQMVFPTSQCDVVKGVDTAGHDVTSMMFTAGNGAMTLIIPMSYKLARGELRPPPVQLALELLKGTGWEATYVGGADDTNVAG